MKSIVTSLALVGSISLANSSAFIQEYLKETKEFSKNISENKIEKWLEHIENLDTSFLKFIYNMEKDLWSNPNTLDKLKDTIVELLEIPKLKKDKLNSILKTYPKYKKEIEKMHELNDTINDSMQRFINKIFLTKEAQILFNIAKEEGAKLGIDLVDTTYTNNITDKDIVLFIHSNIPSPEEVDLDKVYELEDIMETKLKELSKGSTKELYGSLYSKLPIPPNLFFSRVSLI